MCLELEELKLAVGLYFESNDKISLETRILMARESKNASLFNKTFNCFYHYDHFIA